MRVLGALGLGIIALCILVSCRSDEQRVRAWYEEHYAAVKDQLPPAEECDRHLGKFTVLEDTIDYHGDQLSHYIDALISQRRAGSINDAQMDSGIKMYTDRYADWASSLHDGFWSSIGMDGVRREYCVGRLLALYNHEDRYEWCRPLVGIVDLGEAYAGPAQIGRRRILPRVFARILRRRLTP